MFGVCREMSHEKIAIVIHRNVRLFLPLMVNVEGRRRRSDQVTRTALQNAASISALMLTTEALVTEMPEKEKPASGGAGGMGGMDY